MGVWREVHVFPSVISPNIWKIAVLCRAMLSVPLLRGLLACFWLSSFSLEVICSGFWSYLTESLVWNCLWSATPRKWYWGENTGKLIWSLGFLLAQVSESFLLLGEKTVNRTNTLHNGVLTCFSFLAVLTPRKTGTSLSWATQTGSPLPRAVCDAERGFFSCCSISMGRLDSVLSLAPLSLAGRGQLIPSAQLPSWLKLILRHHVYH